MQFRPLVFSTYCTLCYLTFWGYYTVFNEEKVSDFVGVWLECILYGGTQEYCSATYSEQSSQPGGFYGVIVCCLLYSFLFFSRCDLFFLILNRYWQYGLGGLFDFCLEGRRPGRVEEFVWNRWEARAAPLQLLQQPLKLQQQGPVQSPISTWQGEDAIEMSWMFCFSFFFLLFFGREKEKKKEKKKKNFNKTE